jgi:hypothetical protein
MNELYVLMYTNLYISDFRIFNNYDDALIEYLKSSILETKKLLAEDIDENNYIDEENEDIDPQCIIDEIIDEENEEENKKDKKEENEDNDEDEDEDDDDEEDEEFTSCTLQIYNVSSKSSEFKSEREFDIDFFQDLIGNNENLENYINELEEKFNNNEIPPEIKEAFKL